MAIFSNLSSILLALVVELYEGVHLPDRLCVAVELPLYDSNVDEATKILHLTFRKYN